MPTYPEEDLTVVLTAHRSDGYVRIRKCAYAFHILPSTFSGRHTRATTCSRSHESNRIPSTAEEETLLGVVTRLLHPGYPITLPLTSDLTERIRLSRFYLQ
jgi:hypothetical protein